MVMTKRITNDSFVTLINGGANVGIAESFSVAFFCFSMVFVFLSGLYIFMRLYTGIIRLIDETRMKK